MAAGAQTSADLSDQLNNIAFKVQMKISDAHMQGQIASQKARMDDRVACVGMGTRECGRMVATHAAEGRYSQMGDLPPDLFKDARAEGQDAYKAWIADKKGAEIDAAKSLYVAWLTMMDGLSTFDPDRILDFNNSRAGVAWSRARNTFKVDALTAGTASN